jgi:uncharacterized protein (DUF486 family)
VPANKIGFEGNRGPFNLWQLKVIQEVITLSVFTIFTILGFKTETFRVKHLIGFGFLILSIFFIFKKELLPPFPSLCCYTLASRRFPDYGICA